MSAQPFVTLIMPVRNEAAFIERALNAVCAQDYPSQRMEIIVVDGQSTDRTREVVRALQSQHANLRLLDNPGRIVSTGLNIALREAVGEIIVRVDGHCEIAPDYVSRCVECLTVEEIDGVGGPIETIGETAVARAIALAMSSRFGVGGAAFRTVKDKRMLVDTVAFPAYTRRAVERAGLFDEELVRNQDDEYNYRLRRRGGRLLLAPEIRSRYYSRASFRRLWRQYFQYGYWKVRVMQKHARQMSLRQLAPPLFVVGLALSLAASMVVNGAWWLCLVVSAPYVVANLLASILATRKRHARLTPFVFIAHATLHLSYGAGFLVGLCKFWRRWGKRQNSLEVATGNARETESGCAAVDRPGRADA